MTYTSLPSIKGQVTLPPEIRAKYEISKKTPLVIGDKGNGLITIKVMNMVDYDTIQYYENKKGFGLHFRDGVDPKVIIKAIKKITEEEKPPKKKVEGT